MFLPSISVIINEQIDNDDQAALSRIVQEAQE